jgi:hypothetical protein
MPRPYRTLLRAVLPSALACALVSAHPALAASNGDLLFQSAQAGRTAIFALAPDAAPETVPRRIVGGRDVDVAWNGKEIAFVRTGRSAGIWVAAADGSHLRRVTSRRDDRSPALSPDGRTIAFSRLLGRGGHARRARGNGLYTIRTDGTHLRYVGRRGQGDVEHVDWSPDGKLLVHDQIDNDGLFTMTPSGRHVHRLTSIAKAGYNPSFSPDGRSIVYQTDEYGDSLSIMSVTGRHKHVVARAPTDEGVEYGDPVFSPDGRQIAFDTNFGDLLVADADGGTPRSVATHATAPAWAPTGPAAGVAAASTGQINVTVYVGGKRANKSLGLSLCAVDPRRAGRYGVNKKSIVGKCGTPGSRGVVRITRVPRGRWGVAAVGGTGSCAYADCGTYKRVRVRAGHTTTVTWHMPMFG